MVDPWGDGAGGGLPPDPWNYTLPPGGEHTDSGGTPVTPNPNYDGNGNLIGSGDPYPNNPSLGNGDPNELKAGYVWDPAKGKWVPIDPLPTSNSGGGGGGGGGGFGGFQWPTIGAAPAFNAPRFSYENFNAPAPFVAPTGDAVLKEPGYQFRLGQGEQALQQSAAAKGLLRSGGTLKDIIGYGQNFASNEYQNVYGRAASEYDRMFGNSLDVYKTNYGVGRDIFDRNYQAAKDEYAPSFATWQAQTGAQTSQSLAQFNANLQLQLAEMGYSAQEIHDLITSGAG